MKSDDSTKGIKSALSELLKALHPLANDNPAPDSKSRYLRVLEGAFRKNYIRLQAIEKLVEFETTSNPAMEITRNMVEDVVGLEYMRIKGAKKYAEQFFRFWTVHYYQLTHQSIKGDLGIPDTEAKEAERRFNKLPKKLRENKNWAGTNFETQLDFVLKSGEMNKRDASLIEIAYKVGSLNSHFNPYDIMSYLDNHYFEISNKSSLRMSLVFAVSSMVRITTRYVDEINESNGNMDYAKYGRKANIIINNFS